MRNLVLILGDQLNRDSAAFDDFDSSQDRVWMAEVREEATFAWSHKVRLVLFFSAMRHFAGELRREGIPVLFRRMEDSGNRGSFRDELVAAAGEFKPNRLIVAEPGEWRVAEQLREAAALAGVPLETRPDRHFLCGTEEFAAWAGERKQLRLEFFYRRLRAKHSVLMEKGQPIRGRWNFDSENRKTFGKGGPGFLPKRLSFAPDAITNEVIEMVQRLSLNTPAISTISIFR